MFCLPTMKNDAFLRTWKPGVYSEFWDLLDFLMELGQQGENWFLALSPSLPTLGSILHYQDLVHLCGHSRPQVPALAVLTPQMATPWLFLWLSGAHIKVAVSLWKDRHKWAWKHVTCSGVLGPLWSRRKSIGSGWSDFLAYGVRQRPK